MFRLLYVYIYVRTVVQLNSVAVVFQYSRSGTDMAEPQEFEGFHFPLYSTRTSNK